MIQEGTDNNIPLDNKRQSDIRKLIDKVAVRLQAGVENGLFEQKNVISDGPKWIEIQNIIEDARKKLKSDLDEAENLQEKALNKYFESVNKSGSLWKFSGLYAGPAWIFLVGILTSIFFFYYFSFDDIIRSKLLSDEHYIALDVVAWGIIGSVLRGLWGLRFDVARYHYRKGWKLHHISTPFIGGILGAVVYILIYGGLVSVSDQNLIPKNPFAIIPIAAFAGYNWEWAVELFNRVGKLFDFGKDKEDSKS